MALPVYNSKEVKVAWGGVPLEGFSSDSFITLSRNSDVTNEGIGADGQTQVSISPDNSGTCVVSLQQGSDANLLLSAALNALQTTGKLFSATLTITDPAGSVLAFLRGAHIKTAPEVTLSADASDSTRDWTFFVEEVFYASVSSGLATSIADSNLDQIAGGLDTLKNFAL